MKTPMSPRHFRAMRVKRQEGIMALVNDLHDVGFGSIIIESTKIGLEDYWVRAVIDREELGSEDIEKLHKVAANHDATVSLRHDHRTGSRLAVWPQHG